MRTQTKKPSSYLSYSRINLYHHNPQEYYLTYVLGHKRKATAKMDFGSIGHKALAEPGYDWKRALHRQRFLSHDVMVMERAIREHPKYKRREIEFVVDFEGTKLYGWIDAMGPGVIGETKFSAPGTWNQQIVDEDPQIGFYWLVATMLGHKVSKAWLHAVNSRTGEVTNMPTKRLKQDLEGIKNWIRYARDGIAKGVFS